MASFIYPLKLQV